jgi:hypothetical protein
MKPRSIVMRNQRQAVRARIVVGVLLLGLVAAVCSAATLQLGASSQIPAAEGKVKLHQTSSGNTEIKLTVKHLAPPARIDPTSSVFVVWVRGLEPGAQPQNLGALRVNKNLSGKLETTTSLRAFDLFITCEGVPTATSPAATELLPLHYVGK